jgi:integrase-like protein/carboxypeptidase family protein
VYADVGNGRRPVVARGRFGTGARAAGQLRVTVRSDGEPIAGASVVASGHTVGTGADGVAQVDAPPGPVVVTVTKQGFFDGKGEALVTADQVTTVEIELIAQPEVEEEVVVVASTRTGRRLEDQPTRVEVIGREEIEEKLLMTPGDIVMMLNEMGGLRVQAGLRCGEMMALEWSDVDLSNRQLRVERSDWKGHLTSTKGGRVRFVPMTDRVTEALEKHRVHRGKRVVLNRDGKPMTQKMVQARIARAAKAAGVRPGVHILRHTFCSHLAMRGAAPKTIQDLAGHQDLTTTQRYMHLIPSAAEAAIRLLDSMRNEDLATVWQRAPARLLTRLARAG